MDEQLQVFIYLIVCVCVLYKDYCSHYFLANNYTKYIGWMLYDKASKQFVVTT